MTRRGTPITYVGPVTPNAVGPDDTARTFGFQILQVCGKPLTLTYKTEEDAYEHQTAFRELPGAVVLGEPEAIQGVFEGLERAYQNGYLQGKSTLTSKTSPGRGFLGQTEVGETLDDTAETDGLDRDWQQSGG